MLAPRGASRPSSPTSVSQPSGRPSTQSRICASPRAPSTSSSVAAGRARRRFSRIEIERRRALPGRRGRTCGGRPPAGIAEIPSRQGHATLLRIEEAEEEVRRRSSCPPRSAPRARLAFLDRAAGRRRRAPAPPRLRSGPSRTSRATSKGCRRPAGTAGRRSGTRSVSSRIRRPEASREASSRAAGNGADGFEGREGQKARVATRTRSSVSPASCAETATARTPAAVTAGDEQAKLRRRPCGEAHRAGPGERARERPREPSMRSRSRPYTSELGAPRRVRRALPSGPPAAAWRFVRPPGRGNAARRGRRSADDETHSEESRRLGRTIAVADTHAAPVRTATSGGPTPRR